MGQSLSGPGTIIPPVGNLNLQAKDPEVAATRDLPVEEFYEPDVPVDEEKQLATELSLFHWNIACGCVHLAQAIICLAVGLTGRTKDFKLPLTTIFTVWPNGYPQQRVEVVGKVPFAALTSGFAWMSAVAHFIVCIAFREYIIDLRRGVNRFRWVEYAFSSSLMIGLIAMLFGMYDLISLILLCSLNACMNWFGYLMETANSGRKKIDWAPYIFGSFAGLVPWCAIAAYAGAGATGTTNGATVPAFVWGILAAYFVMFLTFPINMGLQYCKISYWSDAFWGFKHGGYYLGEIIYQALSLIAKSLLLWLVVGGTNQPNPGY